MSQYYDCNRLLTMKDENGNKPEIFMVTGNRAAGKTYAFKYKLVTDFIKKGKKFAILVRYNYEMDAIEETFFKDLCEISYKNISVTSEWVGHQLFKKLYIDGQHCGYCVAINTADTIKKYSAMFVDVYQMFFDEFQSETSKYCHDEITKFISIHVSMARGGGEQNRYLPVYMAANAVTIINPYFSLFGIAKRLTPETKFLRGDGWVLEVTYNQFAAEALESSAFGRAVKNHMYIKYAAANSYLLDNNNFIRKIKGPKRIFTVLICDDKEYGIWEVENGQKLYISNKTDPFWPSKIAFHTADHNVSYLLQKKSSTYAKTLREMFNQGRVFFETLEIKNAFLDFIGYTLL